MKMNIGVLLLGLLLSAGCVKRTDSEVSPAPPAAPETATAPATETLAAAAADAAAVAERAAGDAASSTIESCAACHGDSGEGQREKLAPPLAGMPEWYLNKQMRTFIDGRRRPLADEGHGEQMVSLLKETPASELERVAAYYSRLPPIPIQGEVGGDATKGRNIYWGRGACINCHLSSGQGGESSGAPPITIIPAWYFLRQMKAFREGDRAAHTQEEIVQCMVVAASRLDEAACKDVAAYLVELHASPEPAPGTPTAPDPAHGGSGHKH